jgi:hypothetical protein
MLRMVFLGFKMLCTKRTLLNIVYLNLIRAIKGEKKTVTRKA